MSERLQQEGITVADTFPEPVGYSRTGWDVWEANRMGIPEDLTGKTVLETYTSVYPLKKIVESRGGVHISLDDRKVPPGRSILADARALPIESESVDAVIARGPMIFTIDDPNPPPWEKSDVDTLRAYPMLYEALRVLKRNPGSFISILPIGGEEEVLHVRDMIALRLKEMEADIGDYEIIVFPYQVPDVPRGTLMEEGVTYPTKTNYNVKIVKR